MKELAETSSIYTQKHKVSCRELSVNSGILLVETEQEITIENPTTNRVV